MRKSPLRRLLGATVPFLLVLAACGGDDDGGGDADEPTTTEAVSTTDAATSDAPTTTATGGGEAAGYPVTVEHAHGATTIEQAPERIVTLGYNDQDFVLAFDVTPVAVSDWYGDYEHATWPWAQERLGDTKPEVLNKGTFTGEANFNYEAITALEPDLILALYIDVDDTAYGLLSAIAPTVVRTADYPDFGMPWQETTRLVGQVLAQPDRAEEMIADVDQLFEEAAGAHPEFAGKTAAVAEQFEGGSSFVRSANDQRTKILTSLGFVFPDDLAELTGDLDGAEVSDEQMALLDVDFLVWNVGHEPTLRAEIEAKPLYSQLEVVKAGHSIFIEDPLVAGALTWGTVLSIPYALEALVPQFAAALA
jgi:iron complex transport system substrate-binding protein